MKAILPKTITKTTFKHRDWNFVPDMITPNQFNLEEIKTGKVLGRFILPEGSNSTLLNLIASAPELQDIAEMFRDGMIGNKAQNTMVFSIVEQVLERTEQPHEVLECA